MNVTTKPLFPLFRVLASILRAGYRPRIAIVEVNPALCVKSPYSTSFMNEFSTVSSEPLLMNHPKTTQEIGWNGKSRHFGANPSAFSMLAEAYGYEMVYCERCGVNCFLVLKSAMQPLMNGNVIPSLHTSFTTPYACHVKTMRHPFTVRDVVDVDEDKAKIAIRMNPTLLSKIMGANFTVQDLEDARYNCHSGANLRGFDWCFFLFAFPGACSAFPSPEMTTDVRVDTETSCDVAAKGIAAFHSGHFDIARAAFETVLGIGHTEERARAQLLRPCSSRRRAEDSCAQRAHMRYNLAVSLLRLGLWHEAKAAVSRARHWLEHDERIEALHRYLDLIVVDTDSDSLSVSSSEPIASTSEIASNIETKVDKIMKSILHTKSQFNTNGLPATGDDSSNGRNGPDFSGSESLAALLDFASMSYELPAEPESVIFVAGSGACDDHKAQFAQVSSDFRIHPDELRHMASEVAAVRFF